MAVKANNKQPLMLSMADIVLGAEAEVIKAAYEARVKIDVLLAERNEMYQRIAEIESEVDTIMGEQGVFVFPNPPYPVAGFEGANKSEKKSAKKVVAAPQEAVPVVEEFVDNAVEISAVSDEALEDTI